jgi:hypothetical protein
MWVITGGGNPNSPVRIFSDELTSSLATEEQIYLSNQYIKASTISEELFDDSLEDILIETSEDVYDEVDKIAFEPMDEEIDINEQKEITDGN